jgi:hypothetical protein
METVSTPSETFLCYYKITSKLTSLEIAVPSSTTVNIENIKTKKHTDISLRSTIVGGTFFDRLTLERIKDTNNNLNISGMFFICPSPIFAATSVYSKFENNAIFLSTDGNTSGKLILKQGSRGRDVSEEYFSITSKPNSADIGYDSGTFNCSNFSLMAAQVGTNNSPFYYFQFPGTPDIIIDPTSINTTLSPNESFNS